MKSGGQIPWNAIAICRMSKTSWQTGNLNVNEDFGNHSKDQLCYLTHWLDIFSERETKHEFNDLEENYYEGFYWLYLDRGEILEGRHSDCRYWRVGKVGCIRKLSQKTECKRSPDNPKRWKNCDSYGRWFSNIVKEKLRIPRTHSEMGTHRKERESQRRISWRKGRVSISRNKRWRGSSRTLLVYSRRFHLSSSYWTEGSIVRADKRIISYSTELYWCQQVNLCRSGDCTRRTTGWILGCWQQQKYVRVMDWISQDLRYWTKLLKRDVSNPGWDWREFKRHHIQITYALMQGQELGKQSTNCWPCSRTCIRETVVPKNNKSQSVWGKMHLALTSHEEIRNSVLYYHFGTRIRLDEQILRKLFT